MPRHDISHDCPAPPDRAKRRAYVYAVTTACLGILILLLVLDNPNSLTETIAEGLITVLIVTAASYLGASAADVFSMSRTARRRGDDTWRG